MAIFGNMQAAGDFWRKNEYELQAYPVMDGMKHPFAVICPGGGYSMVCSFVEGVPYARRLNRKGCSAFILYYRVKKKAAYPAPQEDLARAVREILDRAEEWNLDTKDYSVWGSSAGGHLAASFGTENMGYSKYDLPRPGAIILTYPVITMGGLTHAGSRDRLLGKNPSQEQIDMASIEKHVTRDYPPVFLWCGGADRTVNPENSRMMERALAEAGVEHEFIEYPGVDHGVGLGKGLACEPWFDRAVRFWERVRQSGERRENGCRLNQQRSV